jgi:hypothetical protein
MGDEAINELFVLTPLLLPKMWTLWSLHTTLELFNDRLMISDSQRLT